MEFSEDPKRLIGKSAISRTTSTDSPVDLGATQPPREESMVPAPVSSRREQSELPSPGETAEMTMPIAIPELPIRPPVSTLSGEVLSFIDALERCANDRALIAIEQSVRVAKLERLLREPKSQPSEAVPEGATRVTPIESMANELRQGYQRKTTESVKPGDRLFFLGDWRTVNEITSERESNFSRRRVYTFAFSDSPPVTAHPGETFECFPHSRRT